jgi:hypothetical protein
MNAVNCAIDKFPMFRSGFPAAMVELSDTIRGWKAAPTATIRQNMLATF